MEEKPKKPDLPKNDDSFWEGAQNEVMRVKDSVICDRALHQFERIKGLETKCMKCRMGYILPVDGEIREGHIYIKGQFVI